MGSIRETAYEAILNRAARYANMDHRKPSWLGGDTFRVPPTFEHLELWYDVDVLRGALEVAGAFYHDDRDEDEILGVLTEIVQDAVRLAIAEEPEAFGALIIEQARNSINPENWF
jgi:hypothetical protein